MANKHIAGIVKRIKVLHAQESYNYWAKWTLNTYEGAAWTFYISTMIPDEMSTDTLTVFEQSGRSSIGNRSCTHMRPYGNIIENSTFANHAYGSGDDFCIGAIPVANTGFLIPTDTIALIGCRTGVFIVWNYLRDPVYNPKLKQYELKGWAAVVGLHMKPGTDKTHDPKYYIYPGSRLSKFINCEGIKWSINFRIYLQSHSFWKTGRVCDILFNKLWDSIDLASRTPKKIYRTNSYNIKDNFFNKEENSLDSIGRILAKERIMVRTSHPILRYMNPYPQLVAKSFDSLLKFDGNLIAYIREIPGLKNPSTLNAFKTLARDRTMKSLASLWLSGRYAERLTVKDTRELIQSLESVIAHPRGSKPYRNTARSDIGDYIVPLSNARGYSAVTLYMSPRNDLKAFQRLERQLREWDAWLSYENAWDMVPYSFVLDWFLTVADFLTSLDRRLQSRLYNCIDALYTLRYEADSEVPGMTWKCYIREVHHSYELSVNLPSLSLPRAINIVDGASLFIQRV